MLAIAVYGLRACRFGVYCHSAPWFLAYKMTSLVFMGALDAGDSVPFSSIFLHSEESTRLIPFEIEIAL